MSIFGFGSGCKSLDIVFDDEGSRASVLIAHNGTTSNEAEQIQERLVLFSGNDLIAGSLEVKLSSKKLEHLGIKIELIGRVEYLFDRANPFEFISAVKELEPAGELTADKKYRFEFPNTNKKYESYQGFNVAVRYFVRVKITRHYSSNIVKIRDFAVENIQVAATKDDTKRIKMEVGIEDCLHIEFEYNANKYHLSDIVIGKIYFLLVRIKIKHMEVVVIKRETTGSAGSMVTQSENVGKFQIMDGAPARGESIPLRIFLKPYKLTPTYVNVYDKFSVRYYLNLVLVDTEDRRYFKQQEISLWRKTFSGKGSIPSQTSGLLGASEHKRATPS